MVQIQLLMAVWFGVAMVVHGEMYHTGISEMGGLASHGMTPTVPFTRIEYTTHYSVGPTLLDPHRVLTMAWGEMYRHLGEMGSHSM